MQPRNAKLNKQADPALKISVLVGMLRRSSRWAGTIRLNAHGCKASAR